MYDITVNIFMQKRKRQNAKGKTEKKKTEKS
jgi:hypothetical protein